MTIDPVAIIGMIGGLSGLAALIDAFSRRKKSKVDNELAEAETASKYLEIADRAAEKALKLDTRVIELEGKVSEQSRMINEQSRMIHDLQCENAALREWAGRLVHQVQAFGGTPVEIHIGKQGPSDTTEDKRNGKRPRN